MSIQRNPIFVRGIVLAVLALCVFFGVVAVRPLVSPVASIAPKPVAEERQYPTPAGHLRAKVVQTSVVHEHGHAYRVEVISDPTKGFMHMEVKKQMINALPGN